MMTTTTAAGPIRTLRTDHACAGCGTVVSRIPSAVRDAVFCTRPCYQRNGAGKVGRRGGRPRDDRTRTWRCPDGVERTVVTHPDGYVSVYWTDHPNSNANRRVAQHVVVVTDQLGRPLEQHESVHHRNGDRSDNRPENLEVWSRAQPAGQRPDEKVAFAIEMLRLYAPERLAAD